GFLRAATRRPHHRGDGGRLYLGGEDRHLKQRDNVQAVPRGVAGQHRGVRLQARGAVGRDLQDRHRGLREVPQERATAPRGRHRLSSDGPQDQHHRDLRLLHRYHPGLRGVPHRRLPARVEGDPRRGHRTGQGRPLLHLRPLARALPLGRHRCLQQGAGDGQDRLTRPELQPARVARLQGGAGRDPRGLQARQRHQALRRRRPQGLRPGLRARAVHRDVPRLRARDRRLHDGRRGEPRLRRWQDHGPRPRPPGGRRGRDRRRGLVLGRLPDGASRRQRGRAIRPLRPRDRRAQAHDQGPPPGGHRPRGDLRQPGERRGDGRIPGGL
ncbi:MAG: Fructokinase, partial [uncultured Rubrobacteraceae bacterium]